MFTFESHFGAKMSRILTLPVVGNERRPPSTYRQLSPPPTFYIQRKDAGQWNFVRIKYHLRVAGVQSPNLWTNSSLNPPENSSNLTVPDSTHASKMNSSDDGLTR